jgi:hypothetical protein
MDKQDKRHYPEEKDRKDVRHHAQDKVVDDSQSPYNESQQQPGGSGDRRMPRAVGVPLPWGAPTDDLHPVDQLYGDVSDPTSAPPGEPGHQKKSA